MKLTSSPFRFIIYSLERDLQLPLACLAELLAQPSESYIGEPAHVLHALPAVVAFCAHSSTQNLLESDAPLPEPLPPFLLVPEHDPFEIAYALADRVADIPAVRMAYEDILVSFQSGAHIVSCAQLVADIALLDMDEEE